VQEPDFGIEDAQGLKIVASEQHRRMAGVFGEQQMYRARAFFCDERDSASENSQRLERVAD
jgi:hypothetical protein